MLTWLSRLVRRMVGEPADDYWTRPDAAKLGHTYTQAGPYDGARAEMKAKRARLSNKYGRRYQGPKPEKPAATVTPIRRAK